MKNETRQKDASGREYVMDGGVKYFIHPNGGGRVAGTAQVADTVYVAPLAVVFGNARLSDKVRVVGRAWVGGDVVASGDVNFGGRGVLTEGTFSGHQMVITNKR